MTSNLELVRTWNDGAWADPPSSVVEANEAYLSDDFQSVDEDGNVVMDKQAYLGMSRMLFASLPDMRWIRSGLREEGDYVIMDGHFEGTFENDLDLSAMGMGVVPASGKKIIWPQTSVKWEIRGDKITKSIPYGEASGTANFLAPLGVKLPAG